MGVPSVNISELAIAFEGQSVCNNESFIAFAGPPELVPIVSLPKDAAGTAVPFVLTSSASSSVYVLASPTSKIPHSTSQRPSSTSVSLVTGLSSPGLTTGDKAGIAVSVIVCFFLLCGILFLLIGFRRRHARLKKAAAVEGDSVEPKAELHAQHHHKPRHELYADGMTHEKDGTERPAELKGTQQVHELSAEPLIDPQYDL